MFTIDLLKGEGRPVRTKPQGLAIFVTTFAVPVLAAILLVGYYVRNGVIISIQKQNIANYDSQTRRLAEDWKFKESCEQEKSSINSCLTEVSTSIRRHIQWSSVLVTLVENLPDSVVLTGLEVKQSTIKRKATAKGGSDKKNDSSIPVRTLKMRVSGNPSYDCDLEVRKFRDRLRASDYLGPRLEDVVVASQGHDTLDGRDVVAYDIDCIFKPGL
jgi:Tfp pilus assembly protein PilN